MKKYNNNLDLAIKYVSGKNNILNDFYLPVLSKSISYKRAVGYFTSAILVEYVKSLSVFYHNGGRMKLIVSPILQAKDIEALKKAEEIDEYIRELLNEQFLAYLTEDVVVQDSAKLFFSLLVSGILEMKIAVPNNVKGIFHEKIGIFELDNGDKIAVSGSNNETYNSVNFNHESFNTFCSWKPGQIEYIESHESDFDEYWDNQNDNLIVLDFAEAHHKELFEQFATDKGIEKQFESLNESSNVENKLTVSKEMNKLHFTPYDYQQRAAESLIKNEGGILKFATGSGKTKTAIVMMQILKRIKSKNFFVIVVPDKTLLEQWFDELSNYNSNIVKCYSDSPHWIGELRNCIDVYNLYVPTNQIIITTKQTMFRNGKESKFIKQLSHLESEYIMIVDECHNFSTEMIMNSVPNINFKVGLSATPETESNKILSDKMIKYFKGIVAEYGLKEAIDDGKLVPYNYYPILVKLNDEERENYKKITHQIVKLQSVLEAKFDKTVKESIELKLFERSRIVYGAHQKIERLKEGLINGSISDEFLLIYCGATSYIEADDKKSSESNQDEYEEISITQLQTVNKMLNEIEGKSVQYTQNENAEARKHAIRLFREGTMSTLVAIKCLDEGVNIPEIRNAVILASTGSMREFVQRRGRILRTSEGKLFANVYDFIVREDESVFDSLNVKETYRLREFASLAMNGSDVLIENSEYVQRLEEWENERNEE